MDRKFSRVKRISKMKTMISLGCSWTWGYDLKTEETYSAHLQNMLPEWQIINAGHCGADVEYSIFSAMNLIEEMDIDFVIFQLTSFDRLTLGTDGYENFLNGRYYNNKDESIYYEDLDSYYKRLIGIADNIKTKYTNGSYILDDEFSKREFKYSGMKNLDFKNYRNFIKILTENISYSTYNFQKKMVFLLMFERYLKSKNIKSLYFSYQLLPADIATSKFYKRFIGEVNFIKEDWKTWLQKNYPCHDFYIDLSHLNSEGNKILAEKYIMPYLKDLI